MDLNLIISTGIGVISSVAGYVVGIRKNKAEVDSLVLQNVKGILEIQSQTIIELKNEVQELKKKIDDYEQYIDDLKSQIKQMRNDMSNSGLNITIPPNYIK